MRYQLGGRVVDGARVPGALDDSDVWGNAFFLRAPVVDAAWIADGLRITPDWSRPRAFGHAGMNVAMPPAVVDARLFMPAIGAAS